MNGLMLLSTIKTLCGDMYELLQILGWVLTIFKVIIPLVIIGLGLIDLGKAAVSSKPEEIKKSATSLAWRVAGGILIFFIPSIVMTVFGFVGGFSKATAEMDFAICKNCITVPWDGTKCYGYPE